jgi:hypothetical protein
VDVTKYGTIPDGGWRYLGRAQGRRHREAAAIRTGARSKTYEPQVGTAFVHTVIDDHSRVAYAPPAGVASCSRLQAMGADR